MEDVALVRCNDYDIAGLRKQLDRAFKLLGGLERFLRSGDRVLLKISLLSAHKPDSAIITHPAIVEALIPLIKALGCEIYIGDSPCGFITETSLMEAYRVSGFQDLADRCGVRLVDFDFSPPIERDSPDGRLFKKFQLASILDSVDKVITVPKLKTHHITYLTNAVKVNYGFIPGLAKVEYHLKLPERDRFCNMLLDLYLAIKPALTVVDAVVGMEGDGPSSGNPKRLGAIIVGSSSLAVDYVSARIMGYKDALEVPTNRLAFERGILDPNKIRILGEEMDSLVADDFVRVPGDLSQRFPLWLYRLGQRLFTPRPYIDYSKCVLCDACFKYCPAECISKSHKGDRLSIDYGKCIRCFCCQELCPKGAVRTRVPVLAGILGLLEKRHRKKLK